MITTSRWNSVSGHLAKTASIFKERREVVGAQVRIQCVYIVLVILSIASSVLLLIPMIFFLLSATDALEHHARESGTQLEGVTSTNRKIHARWERYRVELRQPARCNRTDGLIRSEMV